MKIGFIHPNYPGAEGTGSGHTATQIITGLIDRGHDLTVYCTEPPEQGQLLDLDYETRTVDIPSSAISSPRKSVNEGLRELIPEFDEYDVTHSYWIEPVVTEIGKRTSTTTIVTLTAYGGICPKNDLQFLNRTQCGGNGPIKCSTCGLLTTPRRDGGLDHLVRTGKRPIVMAMDLRQIKNIQKHIEGIDGFHTYAQHIKEKHVRFGFPAEKIHVIRNILDPNFDIEHESDFTDPYQLLFVGRLSKEKGVDKLVPIVERLNRVGDSTYRLTVAGEGDLHTQLEEQVRDCSVADLIELRGHVPYEEMPELYASSDVLVFPGEWEEPFARVFLESLGTGTPIVTSDVGDVREIIDDGGIVVDGSVEGFVETITEQTQEDELRSLSEGANRTAERYQRSKVVDEIEQLYSEALDILSVI